MATSADDQLTDNEHRAVATSLHARWEGGESKSALELEFWGDAGAHGKRFTSYVRRCLGTDTERKSTQTELIERLEGLLRANGISPSEAGDLAEEYRLLAKSRESALAAVRVYNDPIAGFHSETFIVLMVIAWNSLLQAMLERDGVDYYARDDQGHQILIDGRPKVKDTWELSEQAIKDREAVRANLDFFLRLRNLIAHRYLPALDLQISSEAQAMLLNLENLLEEEFGEEAVLGERLAVPLQLSGFRSSDSLSSLRKAQAQLPVDVQTFLAEHRAQVSEEVLRSPEYALQIFFVPVTANRERSADAVVQFLKPGEADVEIEDALKQRMSVVTKPKRVAVASDHLLRPAEVVRLVGERLPYRFTMDTHTRCWRHYRVRPAADSAEPEATEQRYCCFDRLSNGYGYTQAWVDRLVTDLSDPANYQAVVGFDPDLR